MKALVLLSGGIDSAVVLAKTVNDYGKENVETVTYNYGQTNSNEIKYAQLLSDHYGVKNVVVDITNLFKYSNSSLLKHSEIEISHKTYDEQAKEKLDNEEISSNVPFRNGLFLSIATSIAISKNIQHIIYGIHREYGVAVKLYYDISPEFNNAMNKAILIGSGNKVEIFAPFKDITKDEIIRIGIALKVPFEKTWTCYVNGKKPCGLCNSCQDRNKAFKENIYDDPLNKK